MMQHHVLIPRFVKTVPKQLEPGVLYVSVEYGTVVHACCCGCGHEVVTPLTPTDWRMIYDGETVSLWPSVGNWNLPCQSHYIIDRNRVLERGRWSRDEVEAEQRRDKAAKATFYGNQAEPERRQPSVGQPQDGGTSAGSQTKDGCDQGDPWLFLSEWWK